jgi:uncharacterized repeat protein (TIGR01451 family)
MTSRLLRRISAMTAVAALCAGMVVIGAFHVAPAEAVPGVPDAPVVLYSEDFENAPDTGNPQLLTSYVSASPQYLGGTYTAAPFWASAFNCNGFILSSGNTYPAGACNGSSASFTTVQGLAPLLGTIGGTPTATNSIVAAYTAGSNAASNLVEFATVSPIALPTPSRYLTFSVDAAGRNCQLAASSHPQLQFYVEDEGGLETPLGGVIDPCNLADPRTVNFGSNTRGGHYPASGSFLASGASVGIVMRNVNGGVGGNDGAFDNIQVLDGTPVLDKDFGPPNPITGVSTLTLTLTNTSDLATKLGWSALDTLAPGLVVANPSSASSTCTNGSVTAVAGSGTISFAGDLAGDTAHVTSCTFSVDVVPAAPTAQGSAAQIFQNCASNLSGITGIDPPANCATGSFTPVAQLSVTKTGTATASTNEGDVITYSITATNTGGSDYTADDPANVTDDLTGVLDDATYNGDASATAPGVPVYGAPNLTWSGPLAIGASVTITYTMTATLAGDGELTNTACIPEGQASGPACDSVTTSIPIDPSIDLTKSASPSSPAQFTVDQVITYWFVVLNTGNLVLADPAVAEVSFDGAGPMSAISCPPTPSLAPGAQMVCSATYTLVQADIDNHSLLDPLTNSATASATASNDAAVTSPVRSAALPSNPQPSISLAKSAGPGVFSAAGQVVDYSFLITNTGNVTLTDAGVVEGIFSGTGDLSTPVCPPAAVSMLPGAQVTCTASYVLTQGDVDAGTVTNEATATGTPPTGAAVTSAIDDAQVVIAQSPAIGLVKSAGPGGFTEAGEVVAYTFLITNTGNLTLSGVGITEVAFSGTGAMSAPICDEPVLAPGGSTECTASYTLTQVDVDAGLVTNSATSLGTPPTGPPVISATSDALVTITPSTSITLAKTVDRAAVAGSDQPLLYSFVVTNTGQATVHGLVIADDVFTGSGALPTATCPVTTLAPDASTTCTTPYRTTATDVASKVVDNTATATALNPGGAPITSAPSTARVVVDPIAAALAATGAGVGQALLVWAAGLVVAGLAAFGFAVRRRFTARP